VSTCAVLAATATGTAAEASMTGKQGGQLVKTSFALASRSQAVTITGTGTNDKQTVGLDLTVQRNGDATGTITVQGQTMHVVKIGSVGYVKANAAFWRLTAGTGNTGAAGMLAGRWIKASGANSPLAGFDQFLGIRSLFSSFPASRFKWLNAQRTTFHGHPAVAVRGRQGGQTGTVVVATTAPTYPLEIKAPGFVIYLSNWNHAVPVHAPSDAVDISELGG
jgi:hypothetical protein